MSEVACSCGCGVMFDTSAPTSWPSRARCFGTWGYALGRAFDEAVERRQKVYVYKGLLDGESVWVTALDPKRATR